MTDTPAYHLCVGIDIAEASAAVAYTTDPKSIKKTFPIDQTPDGLTALRAQLETQGIAPAQTLVVLEATNTYWLTLAHPLHEHGIAVSVSNPAQAHNFAKAVLKHAKTDALDAQTLAQRGAALQPARGHRRRRFMRNWPNDLINVMRCWCC